MFLFLYAFLECEKNKFSKVAAQIGTDDLLYLRKVSDAEKKTNSKLLMNLLEKLFISFSNIYYVSFIKFINEFY